MHLSTAYVQKKQYLCGTNQNTDCIKKILLFLVAPVSLTIGAQNLEHVFDMDKLAASGGFWGEFVKYSDIDHYHVVFRLTAGLQMAFGDLKNRPWLIGVAPFTGFGLYDMDMVLPVEVRFGKYFTDRWYVMGELTYHVSLADETATLEPAIRFGYNFGRKVKTKK